MLFKFTLPLIALASVALAAPAPGSNGQGNGSQGNGSQGNGSQGNGQGNGQSNGQGNGGGKLEGTRGFESPGAAGTCVVEAQGRRLLDRATFSSDSMTYAACAEFAVAQGFDAFGVEYGRECWVGSSATVATAASSTDCNMPCSGSPGDTCGGPNALTVFTNKNLPASKAYPTVQPVRNLNGWSSDGNCYADSVQNRVLTGAFKGDGAMTYAMCTDFCLSQGFKVAGLEYSSECFCGSLPAPTAPSTQCTMRCSGDNSKICGGGDALVIFTRP